MNIYCFNYRDQNIKDRIIDFLNSNGLDLMFISKNIDMERLGSAILKKEDTFEKIIDKIITLIKNDLIILFFSELNHEAIPNAKHMWEQSIEFCIFIFFCNKKPNLADFKSDFYPYAKAACIYQILFYIKSFLLELNHQGKVLLCTINNIFNKELFLHLNDLIIKNK